MSVRYEFASAKHTSVTYALPGDEIGEDTVSAPEIALELSYDEVFVITGEPGAIRSLAMRMIRATVLAEVKLAEKARKDQVKAAKKAKADEKKAKPAVEPEFSNA